MRWRDRVLGGIPKKVIHTNSQARITNMRHGLYRGRGALNNIS
jgi:hypothetical protein